MSEENKELVRRTWAAFDAGDEEGFLACFAPDWVEHYGTMTATLADALGALQRYAEELTGRETVLEELVAEGELVASRTTRRATAAGSGRPVHVHELSLHRVRGGRLVESWTESSSPSVPDQLAAD